MTLRKRIVSGLLVFLLICAYAALFSSSAEEAPPLEIIANSHRVPLRKTLTLSVNTEETVVWTSDDMTVATVSENGVVRGEAIGTAMITAAVSDGRTASFTVNVVRPTRIWRNLLEKRSILGYRYSYEGDYFYTDDVNCWQKYFGFNFVYDTIAPLYWIECDYVRVFFPYEGKDWMIQMWKGQYGLVFYGSEVGVYNKPEGKSSATSYAHYNAATNEPDIKIGSSLYHENPRTNEYELEFTHPYQTHWWNAGFVPGHLRYTGECSELRTVTHITLKDEEMAKLFSDGLRDCGFSAASSKEAVENETYFLDGADVYLQWQNLKQGVNTHVTQSVFWGSVALNGFFLLLLLGFLLMIGLAVGSVFLLVLI